MILETETPYGKLYKQTRQVELSDFVQVINLDHHKDEYERYLKTVCARICLEIISEDLQALYERLAHRPKYSRIYVDVTSESERVAYNGLRTDDAKIAKYNKIVDFVNEKVMIDKDHKINEAILKLNDDIRNFIKNQNAGTIERATRNFSSLGVYDEEWLKKISDQKALTKLSEVERKMAELKKDQEVLEEIIRVSRVEVIKDFVRNKDDENEDENLDPRLVEPVLEALSAPTALKKTTSRLLLR